MASRSDSGSRRTSGVGPARRPSKGRQGGLRLGRWLLFAWLLLMVWSGVEYARLPAVEGLATGRPGPTALMRTRAEEAAREGRPERVRQRWVGLEAMAPHAVHAVLLSEDARFYQHAGVDWSEVGAALDEALEERSAPRGASTLTQQLAKNLFLSTDRTPMRKAKELILTRRLEAALEKRRILTLYLNVAEWGEGVWGLEAAARAHFGVSAARLSVAQGAMLAAMLPAPRTWTPAKRPQFLRRRARRLVGRLERTGRITAAQAAAARGELDGRVGGGEHPAAGGDAPPAVEAAGDLEG